MAERFYYATINSNGVCDGLVDTFELRFVPNYVQIESYDLTLVWRKMWTGTEWADNPNYLESV